MLHAGVPLLRPACTCLACARAIRAAALEAYPGLLARAASGTRPYKSDDKAKQTPERLLARKDLLTALELGQTRLGLRLAQSRAARCPGRRRQRRQPGRGLVPGAGGLGPASACARRCAMACRPLTLWKAGS